MPTDDEIWDRLLGLMPLHECGQRLQPGGIPATGPLLVCTRCSFVGSVDPEWVDAKVQEASQ